MPPPELEAPELEALELEPLELEPLELEPLELEPLELLPELGVPLEPEESPPELVSPPELEELAGVALEESLGEDEPPEDDAPEPGLLVVAWVVVFSCSAAAGVNGIRASW